MLKKYKYPKYDISRLRRALSVNARVYQNDLRRSKIEKTWTRVNLDRPPIQMH